MAKGGDAGEETRFAPPGEVEGSRSDGSNPAAPSQPDSDAVRRWRARFALTGVDGVGVIAKGRGRKASLPDGMVAEIVRVTCH